MRADRNSVGVAFNAEFVDRFANFHRFEVTFVAQDDARPPSRSLQHDVVRDLQVEDADQRPSTLQTRTRIRSRKGSLLMASIFSILLGEAESVNAEGGRRARLRQVRGRLRCRAPLSAAVDAPLTSRIWACQLLLRPSQTPTSRGTGSPSPSEMQLMRLYRSECAALFKFARSAPVPCGSSPRASTPPSTGTRRRRRR